MAALTNGTMSTNLSEQNDLASWHSRKPISLLSLKQVLIICSIKDSILSPPSTCDTLTAVVLNKNITNVQKIRKNILIPGHAMLVSILWHCNTEIHVLVVYAPNAVNENQSFWSNIQSKLRDLPPPDIMLGDFNFVEDALDRLPLRSDNEAITDSFALLKSSLDLHNGWHQANPDNIAFTYSKTLAQGGSRS